MDDARDVAPSGVERRDGAFIFIAGASGHTGSRLARRLLELGYSLRCLNHNPANRRHLPEHPTLQVYPGDIARPETYVDALRGAACFFNCAHIGQVEGAIAACEAAGVDRLISMSSTRRFTRFPETSAERVIAGEAALERSRLNYTVIRSAMIYGGDRDNNLEKLVRWLRRLPVLPLVAGGRNLVQPIFVWDLVDALVRALERPEATARSMLNVAGPQAMPQRVMIETVARLMGRRLVWLPLPFPIVSAAAGVIEMLPRRRPYLKRDQVRRQLEDKAFDISEAREALGGWAPRSFGEGLAIKLAGEA